MASTPFLIVFDCDGTLVDSQYLISEAMRFAFHSTGLPVPDRTRIVRAIGLSLSEALASLAPDASESQRDDCIRAYRERYQVLRLRPDACEPLFPGASSLLHSLAERDDVILGLATGKSKLGVQRILEDHGLHGLFSTIQTADDAPSKPHPAMLFQAMHEAGVSARSAVMIGDTSHDVLMATAAKVAGIGVTWGYHGRSDLRRAGAKLTVQSFAELARVLHDRLWLAADCEAVA